MKMKTSEQLKRLYGRDCYLVVTGTHGLWTMNSGMSEADAVERYEHPHPAFAHKPGKALATIVCIPSETCGRTCMRGWIRDGYRWDASDPESLRVERDGSGARPPRRHRPPEPETDVESGDVEPDMDGLDFHTGGFEDN